MKSLNKKYCEIFDFHYLFECQTVSLRIKKNKKILLYNYDHNVHFVQRCLCGICVPMPMFLLVCC